MRRWCSSLVACGGAAPGPHATKRAPPPGTVALEDLADGDARLTPDASCRMVDALHAFGHLAVTDCGWFDTSDPPLADGRACARRALAAHAPFVLVWRSTGGDPICDDMAILSNAAGAHCGYQEDVQTTAIVGVRRASGYAMYQVETEADESQGSWDGSAAPAIQHTSRTTVERCATLSARDACEGADCFECESRDDRVRPVESCQSPGEPSDAGD
ncbi:MAG TPA: hypothetical protein VFP84_31985 [Kofleriaceae bacterium]|nr:hypothetical protein [Kofleriaceae bacterium]